MMNLPGSIMPSTVSVPLKLNKHLSFVIWFKAVRGLTLIALFDNHDIFYTVLKMKYTVYYEVFNENQGPGPL